METKTVPLRISPFTNEWNRSALDLARRERGDFSSEEEQLCAPSKAPPDDSSGTKTKEPDKSAKDR
jgi:hypothetical protein